MRRDSIKSMISLYLGLLLLLAVTGCANNSNTMEDGHGSSRIVTDMAGRKVAVPLHVSHVACLIGPSYEKLFLLGASEKVALCISSLPWANQLNPKLANIPVVPNFQNPNLESMIANHIDVIFAGYDSPQQLDKLTKAGIPVVVTQKLNGNPETEAEFIDSIKAEVKLYGDTLGGDAETKAAEWCSYFDRKVKYVTDRTKNIPEEQRPKVYYVRGPDVLTTHGHNSNTMWYVEMAGGNLVSKNTGQGIMIQAKMEDVLQWNPDVIFMGRLHSSDMVTHDASWAEISAVKTEQVYVNPNGVMFWDYSSEGVLLLEYLAKTLHPELFSDLDLAAEVKDYYIKFYNYHLSDDEVDKILKGLPPD